MGKGKGRGNLAVVESPQEQPESQSKATFSVVAGHQFGLDCFAGFILYSQVDILEVLREAQRPESARRIPGMAAYVKDRDGRVLHNGQRRIGCYPNVIVNLRGPEDQIVFNGSELIIGKDVRILVNDGQHRELSIKRAIANGLQEDRLSDGLPALYYVNLTDDEMRQIFADTNTHLSKPSKSINLAYNVGEFKTEFVKDLIEQCVAFRGKVNFAAQHITRTMKETFTFASLYTAVHDHMWGDFGPVTPDNAEDRMAQAISFWNDVDAVLGEVWDTKESYANTTNAMCALAHLNGHNVDWWKLEKLDWSADGEIKQIAKSRGGTNAAIPGLAQYLQQQVVIESAE